MTTPFKPIEDEALEAASGAYGRPHFGGGFGYRQASFGFFPIFMPPPVYASYGGGQQRAPAPQQRPRSQYAYNPANNYGGAGYIGPRPQAGMCPCMLGFPRGIRFA